MRRLGRVQRVRSDARAEAFKDVVKPGHRQMLVLGENAFPERIKVLGDAADALLFSSFLTGEWERIKATRNNVSWTIFKRGAVRHCPD